MEPQPESDLLLCSRCCCLITCGSGYYNHPAGVWCVNCGDTKVIRVGALAASLMAISLS